MLANAIQLKIENAHELFWYCIPQLSFCLCQWITTELLTGHDSTGYYWAPGPDLPTELIPACIEQLNNEGSEHFLLSHRNGEYQRRAGSWTYNWNNVKYMSKSNGFLVSYFFMRKRTQKRTLYQFSWHQKKKNLEIILSAELWHCGIKKYQKRFSLVIAACKVQFNFFLMQKFQEV